METFINYITSCSAEFKEVLKEKKPVAIYCHYDADGLSSAAVLARALFELDVKFILRILKNLEKKEIEEIKRNSHNFSAIIFLDLGSNFLHQIENFNCRVWIIDHHKIENKTISEKIKVINYRLFSNSFETSSSVLTYFFAKSLINLEGSELGKIALIGLIGDGLDRNLSKLSGYFINLVKDKEGIDIKKGLNVFSYSRPIHKALEFSSIYVPGLTGNYENIVNLLRNLKIDLKKSDGKYRTLNDLSEEEISKIITAIATFYLDKSKQLELIGNIYLINLFDLKEDAKEITTLINACGRLDKGHIAVSFLLGRKKSGEIIDKIYAKYKFEILKGIEWINKHMENLESSSIIKEENFLLINAKTHIKDSVIGTICSMLANSGLYKSGFIIMGLAYRADGIKVSLRIVENKEKNEKININAYELLKKIKEASGLDFEIGGHDFAAGAVLRPHQLEGFLKYTEKILRETSITIKIS